ncbi:conserved hypothetical protein [Rhodococcus sp. RD6.2]|nr:conserved hypothetical protein [Rhodococcus sp. RD6.2]
MEGPPQEAYGRVTNPQRFAPLIPAAEELVADLELRFEVTVTREPAVPRRASSTVRTIESIRLIPPDPDQAPLTITTTSFPGLYLDVGAWQHIALPACGCDTCDEQVEDAVEDLVKYCTALAGGKLSERINVAQRTLEHTWDGDDWGRSGSQSLSPQREAELRARPVIPPQSGHWRPWLIKKSGDHR